MNIRYLAILATLTFLGFSAPAFAAPPGSCTPWPECKGGGGDTGGATTVSLRDDGADRLTSDDHADEDYIDKQDKVGANIDSISGNFVMKLTKGNQHVIRTMNFNFTCVVPPPSSPCAPPFATGSSVGPLNLFTSGIHLIDDMGVPSTMHLRLKIVLNLDNDGLGQWVLFFDDSIVECTGGAKTEVTRTDDDIWVIVGQTVCLAKKSEQGGELMPRGVYDMPFEMTVQTN